MKLFLLRFKGTIFASAQIQKMTAKISEQIMWYIYVYGPFDKIRAEEPPRDFYEWKKTCSFSCKPTRNGLVSSVYFYRIFGISIFNTCSYGELFTGVSPSSTHSELLLR